MGSSFEQGRRPLAIKTVLPMDDLLLQDIKGIEEISRDFVFHATLLSKSAEIAFEEIVGTNCTFGIRLTDGEIRFFNGNIISFEHSSHQDNLSEYKAEIRPGMWFLNHTRDCKIFQEKSIADIISELLDEYGVQEFEWKCSGNYEALEYCVQYRESAYDFIHRLLEENGVSYYYEHSDSSHKLVFIDTLEDYPESSQATVDYAPVEQAVMEESTISSWKRRQQVKTGLCSVNDYNFTTPKTSLLNSTPTAISLAFNNSLERYDYPGRYGTGETGASRAEIWMEREEANSILLQGEGTCRAFSAGNTFTLEKHPRNDQNAKYLLTKVFHKATVGSSYQSGASEDWVYENEFECATIDVFYRAIPRIQTPLIHSTQTAVVVGPSGEELHVDEFGRIKVQFHWDRYGQLDDQSSCWIRISHSWASKGWGAQFLPRIGQEVVVSFLEGNPDKPLITGVVYNADNMPMYSLPEHATRTVIKTSSSKGGEGFNELRFEDKAGEEHIFIHAQKDQHNRVLNNDYRTVLNDEHQIIDNDSFHKVTGDQSQIVGGDRLHKTVGSVSRIIEGDQMSKIQGSENITVQGSLMEQVDSDYHQELGGDLKLNVSGAISREAGGDLNEKSGGNIGVEASSSVHIKGGMNITLEASSKVTLKCGGSSVTLDASGVAITGPQVKINSGGAPGSGDGCSPDSPEAPMEAEEAIEAEEALEAEAGQLPELAEPVEVPEREFSPQAQSLAAAAENGSAFCET